MTGRSSIVVTTEDKKTSRQGDSQNNIVATGRFTFHKKSLHYSFYISERAARPRALQFLSPDGTILEEHVLSSPGGHVNSIYQNNTRKICGIWRRLPREYRKLLKEEKLYVGLVWGDFILTGQLSKFVALGSELFSSLLEPAAGTNLAWMQGAGGTAIVSTSITVSPSVHIAAIFNGLFIPEETFDVPIKITLALEGKQTILEETIKVRKPTPEINLVEVSSPVSPSDLRLLTRGKLVLSLSSVSKPNALKLTGNVITKITCELFQSALTSPTSDKNHHNQAAGLAWLYLNNDGSLVYNIQVERLKAEETPVFVTLVETGTKRKTELEDLTPYFNKGSYFY